MMNTASQPMHRRILIIDDNPAIHQDFRKILCARADLPTAAAGAEAAFFGDTTPEAAAQDFDITSAYQGEAGLAAVREAVAAGQPFALALVDVRMPPGWDGVETTARLWEADPELQIVLCTAYSDYSFSDIVRKLGASDRLLILKKPFDVIEVLQLANTLVEKWRLSRAGKLRLQELDGLVEQRTRELRAANQWLTNEIGERKQSEEKLRATQMRLKHLLDHSPTILYSLKTDGRTFALAWVSENVRQLLGYDSKEVCEPGWWQSHLHSDDGGLVTGARERLLAENRAAAEYRCQHRDGTLRWLRDEQRLVKDAAGKPVEVVGNWIDITERKALESQLRQAQKMQAIGELAGGVAHDFNNLLAIIRGYTELLLAAPERSNPEAGEWLNQVLAASDRAASLTRQLLAFSRKQVIQPKLLDLNQVLANVTTMLKRLLGENIPLECCYAPNLPVVRADVGMIEQVLVNLAVNARDAMPKGGHLRITTGCVRRDSVSVRTNLDLPKTDCVSLTITDTGTGIAPEHVPRIFEPFFTTKGVGKGSGLGLATVYGIVKQHQGAIEVASQPGAGATFTILLPPAEATTAAVPLPSATTPLRGGSEKILLVEDDDAVRTLTRRILEKLGYRIQEASSGRQALELAQNSLSETDLLLTDMVMPEGVTGRDLAERLLEQKPGLKVIFMSGYTGEAVSSDAEFMTRTKSRFLQKPCSGRDLVQAVRQSLDETASEQMRR